MASSPPNPDSQPESHIPKKLCLAHLNICSLRNKIHEIDHILALHQIHVLALSETHLDPSLDNSKLYIKHYSLYRRDRDNDGGGVAFYIHNQIPSKVRRDLMRSDLEIIWVQLQLDDERPVLVGCCYRPPISKDAYLNKICERIEAVSKENMDIFLLGDFNIDWAKTSYRKKKIDSVSTECQMKQIMDQPTRVTIGIKGIKTSTIIDHIYTNIPDRCSNITSTPTGCSDHDLISVTVERNVPKLKEEMISQRSYETFDEASYISDIRRAQWTEVETESDPERALSRFTGIFSTLADKHAPLERCRAENDDAPWMDQEIKSLMLERDDAKMTARAPHRHFGNICNASKKKVIPTKIKKKKEEYFQQRLREADNDIKKILETLNDFKGMNSCSPVTNIESAGRLITDDTEIANYLNQYYVDKTEELKRSVRYEGPSLSCFLIRERIMNDKQCSLRFDSVDVEKVESLLSSLSDDISPGADNMDVRLLKQAASYISAPICHIVNQSLERGVFPSQWKESKITLMSKNRSSHFSAENSSPVSLLPVLSHILEQIIHEQILKYFMDNELISESQHAFRPDHSTCSALVHMTDDWYKQLDEHRSVGAVFMDFIAAFEVSHDLLVDKLECYNFSDSALSLMGSYLSGRRQTVCYNGCFSDFRDVVCGVPQRSVLGQLLFSIFVNDLPLVLEQSSIVMYADHMTVYYPSDGSNDGDLTRVLGAELQAVHDWVSDNKMVLNKPESKSMIIRRKSAEDQQLRLSVQHMEPEQVKQIRFLGMTLDEHLSWSPHINDMTKKMKEGLEISKKCSTVVSKESKTEVVESLVLSHLDYCSVIWSTADKKHLNQLQLVQYSATRVVFGCGPRTGVYKMHDELSWRFVEDRSHDNLLDFMRTAVCSGKPASFSAQLNFLGETHAHSTRSVQNRMLLLPRAKTDYLKRTVIYRVSDEWNKLPNSLKELYLEDD